jgi:hypothetical protein
MTTGTHLSTAGLADSAEAAGALPSWRLGKGRLTVKAHGQTSQGQCGVMPVRIGHLLPGRQEAPQQSALAWAAIPGRT